MTIPHLHEKINKLMVGYLWDKREVLEQEIAQDFSYYLWNLCNIQERPIPQEILLNFGIALGRLKELDGLISELDPRHKIRGLEEMKASLYSRLP